MTDRQRWTLVATIIGSGTVFLDGTIVNTALPKIGQQLPASSASVRSQFQPLNPPPATATPDQADAAKRASIEAFHLAMLVSAGLLVIGSAVSWIGLREGPSPAGSAISPTAVATDNT